MILDTELIKKLPEEARLQAIEEIASACGVSVHDVHEWHMSGPDETRLVLSSWHGQTNDSLPLRISVRSSNGQVGSFVRAASDVLDFADLERMIQELPDQITAVVISPAFEEAVRTKSVKQGMLLALEMMRTHLVDFRARVVRTRMASRV